MSFLGKLWASLMILMTSTFGHSGTFSPCTGQLTAIDIAHAPNAQLGRLPTPCKNAVAPINSGLYPTPEITTPNDPCGGDQIGTICSIPTRGSSTQITGTTSQWKTLTPMNGEVPSHQVFNLSIGQTVTFDAAETNISSVSLELLATNRDSQTAELSIGAQCVSCLSWPGPTRITLKVDKPSTVEYGYWFQLNNVSDQTASVQVDKAYATDPNQ